MGNSRPAPVASLGHLIFRLTTCTWLANPFTVTSPVRQRFPQARRHRTPVTCWVHMATPHENVGIPLAHAPDGAGYRLLELPPELLTLLESEDPPVSVRLHPSRYLHTLTGILSAIASKSSLRPFQPSSSTKANPGACVKRTLPMPLSSSSPPLACRQRPRVLS